MKENTATNRIEVLSPVGNREMLEAAVRSGADAVYMGMRDFNARRSADNFDGDEFREAVKYCHIRGVRVYLTLNTLLSDAEFTRALSCAAEAYRAGVDAIIVQDLGLARLLHSSLPDLPLHASTQLTAHSPSALAPLKELGFTQVVASREMSRHELKQFCQEARRLSLDVEVFIHGALCMCMSGQCFLSAMLGGRSGNRGLCAGPCRLPFGAKGGTGFDLSLKDLSLVEYIDELEHMGVRTIKIEGRMKRPEYVAAAAAVCRKTVDGEECDTLKDTLSKIFSRSGFTDGYYNAALGRNMFGIRTRDDVTMSAAVIKSLHELYRNERRSVRINGEFVMEEGSPVRLSLSDGEHTVNVVGAVPEAAKNRAADREYILSQLTKTGGTPYVFDRLETVIGNALMLSAGALNALRREALAELSDARYSPREGDIALPKSGTVQKKTGKRMFARFASLSQMPSDLSGLDAIILPLEEPFESANISLPFYVDVPRGIVNEDFIKNRLETAKAQGATGAFCGNLAAVALCRQAGLDPMFDFGLNIFGSESASTAAHLGAVGITLSFEMTAEQINALSSPIPTGIIAYGRLPLMLMRNCPIKNGRTCAECDKCGTLTDRKGITFPVRCRVGYSELFNSKPLYLAERIDEFSVDYITLYFTFESREECRDVIERYQNGTPSDGGHTRGLYYRGVE